MTMRTVLFVDSPRTSYVRGLDLERELLGGVARVRYAKGMAEVEGGWLEDAACLVVFHGNTVSEREIARLRTCSGIVTATVGTDHIDLESAKRARIAVRNIPASDGEDVADHAMMLLLACARHLRAVSVGIERGHWSWEGMLATKRLRGRTLGLVGFGRIGRAMAERALAFGLRVLFIDPSVADVDPRVTKVDALAKLLAASDFVSLHCPLTDKTRGLIDAAMMKHLKPGAILVNTARGALIDEEALIARLKEGLIGGLGLDVLADEPNVPEGLRDDHRVFVTPHAGFYTEESLTALRTQAVRAALELLGAVNEDV